MGLVRSICAAMVIAALPGAASAQFAVPVSKPNPESLFRNQCATCHTLDASEPARQGPTLAGVFGRRAGSVTGFAYSPGFAKADFNWDAAHLDRYLDNPQDVVPGAVMPYAQDNPEIRAAIIGYLKEQR